MADTENSPTALKWEVAAALLEKVRDSSSAHNAERYAVAYALVVGTLTSYSEGGSS